MVGYGSESKSVERCMNFSHTDLTWNGNMKYLMLFAYMAIILDLKFNPHKISKIVETLANNCFPPDGFCMPHFSEAVVVS